MTQLRRFLGSGVIVAALAAVLAGYGLGTTSLHNKDEALHALVTADLVESGDWLDLTLEGEPYLAKAPLRFWLTAPLVRTFGFNAWTVRFWSTAFGVATVVLLYWGVARRWGPAAGAWSAVALATSHHFLYSHATRSGELDTTLLFFWSAALLALAEASATRRPGWLVAAGALAGTAAMSKHLLFLPELAVIAGLAAALGVGRGLSARWWLVAAAAGLAVALPWHAVQWLRHGDAFLATYFGTEVAGRLSGEAPGGAAGHGPLFYLRELLLGFFPWSLLLPAAVPLAAQRGRRGDPLATIFLVWGLVALTVPSLAASKLPWYVLPTLPAAAALIGWLLAAWPGRAPHLATDLAIGAALALALLSPTNAPDHNPFSRDAVFGGLAVDWLGRGTTDGPWVLSACLLLGAVIVLAASARRPVLGSDARRLARAGALSLFAVLALWNASAPLLHADTQSAVDVIFQAMDRHARAGEARHLLVERAYGARYAARRAGVLLLPLELVKSDDCEQPPPGLMVTTTGIHRELREGWRRCGRSWQILEREPPYLLVRVEDRPGFDATGPSAGTRPRPRSG